MIKGIAHVAFNVTDMSKSLQFYCDVLGFQKVFEIRDDHGNPWIEYIKIRQGQFIELFYAKEALSRGNAPGLTYSHLCLEVDDIHAIADRLRAKGLTLDVEPKQGKDGNYQCWVRDPDDNRIEFMQMDPNSLQSKS
ncbi:lactoylglutathione lyase [Hydrogenispora ethanolica]|jgi:lactoylglutathione lyase|uniref:Lactoylglutathione lyase n=1 Tax=Hydrogenispora ethanolica TaxID=1082276 RepID=A0A4R1R8T7_HYDET|nr:VOC family protein [Hydrogenispora ethanolica]TCL62084.1 lactoylglutathione lyase [Hydrogenispora ethanolica]